MRLYDMRSELQDMGVSGIVQETNAGTLLRSSSQDGHSRIYRSTDDGNSWSTVCTMDIPTGGTCDVRGAFVDSRGHIYMGGAVINCTYESRTANLGYFGQLWKSSDDGVTWRKVATSDSAAFWHFSEDSSKRVYVNEYSRVPDSGTEYPALNIWRSDVTGETFTKWHSAVGETTPGGKDGVRHIHTVYVDAADRVFVCYGDASWGGLAGHIVRLDASGAVDIDYGKFDNGSTSMMASVGGMILIGKDHNPSGIDVIHPAANQSCTQCDFRLQAGTQYDAYVFDLVRSADGTIFGNVTLASRYPSVCYSTDNGVTWGLIDYGNYVNNTLTLNPNGTGKYMYLSGAVKRLRIPTKAELKARHPWHIPG